MAVYLVRSSRTYARIRSLTTGTFNLVVKDRTAIRRSGAYSVQADPHKCESGCPRNPTNILCFAKPCQSAYPTEFPPLFHIGKRGSGSGGRGANQLTWRRTHSSVESGNRALRRKQQYGLPLQSANFGARRSGRQKIEKRSFGGPCFEGTLQKPTSVSESSPVAGTT